MLNWDAKTYKRCVLFYRPCWSVQEDSRPASLQMWLQETASSRKVSSSALGCPSSKSFYPWEGWCHLRAQCNIQFYLAKGIKCFENTKLYYMGIYSPTFMHVLPLLLRFGGVWTCCLGLSFTSQQRLSDAQRLAWGFGRRLHLAACRAEYVKHKMSLFQSRSYPALCAKFSKVWRPHIYSLFLPSSFPLPHQGVVLFDLPADEVMAGEGRVLKKESKEGKVSRMDTIGDG